MVNRGDTSETPIVLLVTQLERAGAQKIAITLARYFHQHGYPIKLVFFYDKAGIITELQQAEPYPVINLAAKQPGAGGLSNVRRFLISLWKLYGLLKQFQPTAVITFTHYSNVLGIPLAWAARVPVRLASQRNSLLGFPRWFLKLDAWIANSFLTNRMIAVSNTTARFCIEHERMRPEKVITIRNGIDVTEFALSHEERQAALVEIQAHWDIPPDTFLIATIARLHPQKGHHYLIEAAKKMVEQQPNIVFLIIGEGAERKSIESLIRTYELTNHFRLLGTRSDIPVLLGIVDLFILPSLYEGLPNSLLEAMAAQVPVVATAVGGVPEVVTDGTTGLLVSPGDVDQLSWAMDTLIQDEAYRTQLAQAAYTHVCEYFSHEAMLLAYENLLIDHLNQIRGVGH
jgi:glycosyltransferase involved in cell wall biosynthesis